MESDRHRHVEQLLRAALERAPGERATFLATACGGDENLRLEVEAMVAAHDPAKTHVQTHTYGDEMPLVNLVERASVVEHRVGPYRIIREIGRGGMGAVFLAARADDAFDKQVAIKLVGSRTASRSIIRRFRNERQILASLEHPNIARLLDGGTTTDGQPYFVMEHVAGEQLLDYCDRERLTITERLKLFQKICSAVQHAHQNLVVHRDLKPNNILVTADGEPKLLDFGIAKLLAVTPGDENLVETAPMGRAMTPAYASPEHARGETITTASDVYSLGVVLYNLLTGHHPYRLERLSMQEVERVICDTNPDRPSDVITRVDQARDRDDDPTPASVSIARGVEPERLRRLLRGDLDNIVLMAMRKEPQRRYASAADLSDDIARSLGGLPVRARQDTVAYRASKFVVRHKVSVAAAALVMLSLIGGIVATVREARIARAQQARAEQRFNDVRRLANSLLLEIDDSVKDLAGSTPTRELLVTRALEYLDSLAQESQGDPSLQQELMTAYEKVGDIQGNPYVANLGDTEGALESYRKALAIGDALEAAGGTPTSRIEVAITHRSIGDILGLQGDLAGCVESYRRSLAILEDLSARDPSDDRVRAEVARAHEALGDGLGRAGDHAAQLESYRASVSICEALLVRDPANVRLQRGLAVGDMKLGEGWVDDEAQGIASFRRSIALFTALAAADPNNARMRRDLSMVQNRLGEVLIATGDVSGALEILSDALAIREKVAADDPANAQAHFDLATVRANVAVALTGSGRADEGTETGRRALAGLRELVTDDPENMTYRRNLGICCTKVASAHESVAADTKRAAGSRASHWREARALYKEALAIYTDLNGRGALRPGDVERLESLASDMARCDERLAAVGHS
jgi:non-specific serine/threonine protein kinase/serine/threonine-protein kinase